VLKALIQSLDRSKKFEYRALIGPQVDISQKLDSCPSGVRPDARRCVFRFSGRYSVSFGT